MDPKAFAFTSASSKVYVRLVGCALYVVALVTGSMGLLLDSPSLVAPSLLAGSAVLITAIWYTALVLQDRRARRAQRTPRQSDWTLKRAS